MSDNNKPWVVDIETVAPWGLCAQNPPQLDESVYKSYAVCSYPSLSPSHHMFRFQWFRGNIQDGRNNPFTGDAGITYDLSLEYDDGIREWAIQTYDLPHRDITIDDTIFGSGQSFTSPFGFEYEYSAVTNHDQKHFETEAEAIAYAESIQNPVPIITFNDGDYLFRCSFRQEIDGVTVDRNAGIQHTGDSLKIYTINDLINYYADAMGIDSPFLGTGSHHFNGSSGSTFGQAANCETSLNISVFNVDNPVASTITVDPDFQGIPGSSSITIVDGDPVVSGTMLENGGGSVTVSDNGNISMLNDGGTFFLNEFGNVGFFANGDASLTANTQVQLGSGGTTFNVCLLYTSPSPRDRQKSRMPSSA